MMSTGKAVIFDCDDGSQLRFQFENNQLCFYYEVKFGFDSYKFNRSEAHLLMLYLQEHLK